MRRISRLVKVTLLSVSSTSKIRAMATSLQQFLDRAEQAERKIQQLEKRLAALTASTTQGSGSGNSDSVEEKQWPDESVLPMVTIKDEAIVISEKGRNARMTVTLCDGEANPPFISARGINDLKQKYDSNELDIYVNTYAKCGTTLTIHMVYRVELISNMHMQ